MKTKEYIYRDLLYAALEKDINEFQQKELAKKFSIAVGTVHNTLKPLRNIHAIEVGGRGFRILDRKKILYFWACHRNFEKDVVKKYFMPIGVKYRSALLPPDIAIGGYEHLAMLFKEFPADFDTAIWYADDSKEILKTLEQRLKEKDAKDNPTNKFFNTFILKKDSFLQLYNDKIPYVQSFVDIFNRSDWYAKDYVKAFEEHFRLE